MALIFCCQIVPSASGTSTTSRGMLTRVISVWFALTLASMIESLFTPLP
jgi:hypothetical protein